MPMLETFSQDRFHNYAATLSQLLNQPQCRRLAKLLTWIKMMHMNIACASLKGLCEAPNRI